MILSYASLALCHILLIFFGYQISKRIISKNLNLLFSTALSYHIGLAVFILAAHVLSYLTQSFRLSTLVLISIIGICSLFLIYKEAKAKQIEIFQHKLSPNSKWLISFALIFAFSALFRTLVFGLDDAQHIAFSANIAYNDFYPPRFVANPEQIFDFYHYGMDLVGAFFLITSPAINPIFMFSLQLFIATLYFPILLFNLLNHFVKSEAKSWACFFSILLFTSFNAIDFFFHLEHLAPQSRNLLGHLNGIMQASMTSSDCFPNNSFSLPLMSVVALVICLVYLVFSIKPELKDKNPFYYISLVSVSFLTYFVFPAYWYPILAGASLVLAWQFFKTRDLNKIYSFLALLLGKVLTFTASQSTINGINALRFNPHETWTMGILEYLPYFYKKTFYQVYPVSFEERIHQFKHEIPWWSPVTLRDFAAVTLIALIIFLIAAWLQRKKKILDPTKLCLFFAGFACFIPVFFFTFDIAPIETTRFLFCSKFCHLVFIAITLAKILEIYPIKINTVSKYCLIGLWVYLLIPGLFRIIPSQTFKMGGYMFKEEDKKLADILRKYQTSGDQMLFLSTDFRPPYYDTPYIAGFYDIAGDFLREHTMTKKTGLYLLNPQLLKQLEADYVLINTEKNKLSQAGLARLRDTKYFSEIEEVRNKTSNYLLYKFNTNNLTKNDLGKQDFYWTFGYQDGGKRFLPLKTFGKGQPDFARLSGKQGTKKVLEEVRQFYIDSEQIPRAIFTNIQAVPRFLNLDKLLKENEEAAKKVFTGV